MSISDKPEIVNPSYSKTSQQPNACKAQTGLDADTQQFFKLLHGDTGYVLIQDLSAGKDGKQRQSYWYRAGQTNTLPRHVLEKGNVFFGINTAIEIVTDADRAKYPGKNVVDVLSPDLQQAITDTVLATWRTGGVR